MNNSTRNKRERAVRTDPTPNSAPKADHPVATDRASSPSPFEESDHRRLRKYSKPVLVHYIAATVLFGINWKALGSLQRCEDAQELQRLANEHDELFPKVTPAMRKRAHDHKMTKRDITIARKLLRLTARIKTLTTKLEAQS